MPPLGSPLPGSRIGPRLRGGPLAVGLTALCLALLVGDLARASSPSIFGIGSRESAMGDAAVGASAGPTAAYYNPGGIAMGQGTSLYFGALGYGGILSANNETRGITNPVEISLGTAVPMPLKGPLAKRIWFGVLLGLHPDILVRIIARFPTDAFYPYFDNRTQRVVVLAGMGVRILDSEKRGRLGVGVTINFLAGLFGSVQAAEGATRSLEPRVSLPLDAIAKINVGFRYSWRWLHVGLAYRQQFELPFVITSANVVAGTNLDLNVAAKGLFTPHTIVAGFAATPRPNLRVAIDLEYALWRFFEGPYVQVNSVLPLVGSLQGDLPGIKYKDTIAVRVGGEYVIDLKKKGMKFALRGGVGFETSPVPDQPGRTNMLDGHKLILSLGGGLFLGRITGKRQVWLEAHARLHVLIPRTITKVVSVGSEECPAQPPPLGPDQALSDEVPCDRNNPDSLGIQISNPGYPSIRASGVVISGGVSLRMDL